MAKKKKRRDRSVRAAQQIQQLVPQQAEALVGHTVNFSVRGVGEGEDPRFREFLVDWIDREDAYVFHAIFADFFNGIAEAGELSVDDLCGIEVVLSVKDVQPSVMH